MKRRLLFLLLLLSTSLACGIPAGIPPLPFDLDSRVTPAGPDNPTPGAAPTVTSTPTGQLPTPKPLPTGSSRYFRDDFNSARMDWKTFVTSGEAGLFDLRVEEGFLVFDLGGREINAFALYQPEVYKNVRMDVRVANRGEAAYRVSLICRYDEEEGWYQFDVFNTGLYNIYYFDWNEDKQADPTPLAEGGSDAMRVDGSNELTVVCNDRDLSLFINGSEARTLSESIYFLRDGQVGVGVSSFTQLPALVGFDWLMVSLP